MQNVRAPSYRERGNKYFIALNQNILKFLWMQNVRAPSYREGGNKYVITLNPNIDAPTPLGGVPSMVPYGTLTYVLSFT